MNDDTEWYTPLHAAFLEGLEANPGGIRAADLGSWIYRQRPGVLPVVGRLGPSEASVLVTAALLDLGVRGMVHFEDGDPLTRGMVITQAGIDWIKAVGRSVDA